jgi:uncharacterized lipoprotein YajG
MPTCSAPISVSDQNLRASIHTGVVTFFPRTIFALWIATIAGCAPQPLSVPISYMPPANILPAHAASSAHVFVVGEDQREDKTRVGQMGRGPYGIPLVTATDVGDAAREAMEKELLARGFVIGSGPTSSEIRIQIIKFGCYDIRSPFSLTVIAELIMHVQVERPGKVITYSQNFDVRASSHSVFGSLDNYSDALSAALKRGVQKLFDDPPFMDALLPKPKPAPSPASPHPAASPAK